MTIPIEARRKLGTDEDSYLEVSVGESSVTFRKRKAARPLGEDDPIWGLLGRGASGAGGVSRDHDRYLAEAERRRWRESS